MTEAEEGTEKISAQPTGVAMPGIRGRNKGGNGNRSKPATRSILLLISLFACLLAGGLLLASILPFYFAARKYELGIIRTMGNPEQVAQLPAEAFSFLHAEKPIILGPDQFPEHLRDALVAREDSRFWDHHGVDLRGIARAALKNIREGELRQGAGTITMQLARTAYGFQARTLQRKILEAMLALRIERNFTKEEILTAYMNWVFLGMDNHGFERASREYFRKSTGALTLGEAAALVGMLRAPNRLDPVRHPQAALRERDAVLRRMIDEGMLLESEAASEMLRPLANHAPR